MNRFPLPLSLALAVLTELSYAQPAPATSPAAPAAAPAASAPWAGKDNVPSEKATTLEKIRGDANRPQCKLSGANDASGANCTLDFDFPLNADQQWFFFPGLSLNLPAGSSDSKVTLGSLDGLASTYTLGGSLVFEGPAHKIVPGEPLPHDLIFSLSYKGGPQSSTWYDGSTLAKSTTSHYGDNLAALAGITLGEQGSSGLYIRLSTQRTYKDSTSKLLCPVPSSGQTTPLNCVNGPIGAPKEKTSHVLGLEADVGSGPFKDFPLKVMANYDFKNHITGAEIPIYLKRFQLDALSKIWLSVDPSWSNDPTSKRPFTVQIVLTTSEQFQPYHAN